ncbi:MAG: site-specific integrase [Acidaminococcus sp.]|jgi:integrase|nr:site-specific integrase [Acidaminococcus sp.]MCI2116633.1 site-specific integrase [Acidaminococcus sp.]
MWIEKTKTGYAFREMYKDPLTGKRKKVSVSMPGKNRAQKKAAEEKLAALIKEKTERQSDVKLFDLIDRFLKSKEDTIKSGTMLNYLRLKKRLARYVDEDALAERLKPVDIQFILDDLKKRQSRNYAVKMLVMLRGTYLLGERLGLIKSADAVRCVVVGREQQSLKKVESHAQKFLTVDELKEVISLLRKKDERVADICEFLSLTGLRYGELAALRDEDYDGESVFVNGTLVWSRKRGEVPERGTPKNAYSVRKVKLDAKAKKIIDKFVIRNKMRRAWEPTIHDRRKEKFIFTNRDGGPVDISYVNRQLRKLNYKKKLSTHIFRHTHISMLAEKGVPLKAIMQRVGHNDPATTLAVYSHVSEKMENDVVKALNTI